MVNTFCDPKFSKIKTAYEKNFINGLDVDHLWALHIKVNQ